MKKLVYITTVSIVVTLLMASAAVAQEAGPGGEGPCTGTPFERFIPEVNGCVTTEGLSDPGSATVFDADTREPIGTLDEVTAGLEEGNGGDTTGGQYEEETPPATPETPPTTETPQPPATPDTGTLPDTGGPGLVLPAAGLLLAAGLVGLKVARRRS